MTLKVLEASLRAEAAGQKPRSLEEATDEVLDTLIPVAERVQASFHRTPEGHLRPLHWLLLGVTLCGLGMLPVRIGARADWVLQLPWAMALAGGWCVMHALASAFTQSAPVESGAE